MEGRRGEKREEETGGGKKKVKERWRCYWAIFGSLMWVLLSGMRGVFQPCTQLGLQPPGKSGMLMEWNVGAGEERLCVSFISLEVYMCIEIKEGGRFCICLYCRLCVQKCDVLVIWWLTFKSFLMSMSCATSQMNLNYLLKPLNMNLYVQDISLCLLIWEFVLSKSNSHCHLKNRPSAYPSYYDHLMKGSWIMSAIDNRS